MELDLDRFRFERVYRNTAPVQVLMADFARLKGFDAEVERQQKLWSSRGQALGISAFVAFLLSFVALAQGFGPWGFGLTAALLVGLFVCISMSSRLLTLDLQDKRYELVVHLLKRLRRDIAPDEPVSLDLDFRPTSDLENLKDRGSVGQWKTESFAQQWLVLQARLLDGTHLRLGMEERLQLRRRTKRNPRGKYKTKNKQKGASLLHVQLRVKPERHPRLAQLAPKARAAVQLPLTVRLTRLEVTDDRLSMRAGLGLDWDLELAPRTFLMMLLSLYQVLNYSTALRKQAVAKVAP